MQKIASKRSCKIHSRALTDWDCSPVVQSREPFKTVGFLVNVSTTKNRADSTAVGEYFPSAGTGKRVRVRIWREIYHEKLLQHIYYAPLRLVLLHPIWSYVERCNVNTFVRRGKELVFSLHHTRGALPSSQEFISLAVWLSGQAALQRVCWRKVWLKGQESGFWLQTIAMQHLLI